MRSAFFLCMYVLHTGISDGDARCFGHIEAMLSEQGLLYYISITPYVASTGTVLAAQSHVHVKTRNGTARRPESLQSILILHSTRGTYTYTYNKKQGRQLQDKDVMDVIQLRRIEEYKV